MSLSDAVFQMLEHLDEVLGLLPEPMGNTNKIPHDVVVLRSLKKNKDGIGRLGEEDPQNNTITLQGQFSAKIDVHLWSKEIQDTVDRSRIFMTEIFNMDGATTLNGIFRHLDLTGSLGPDYFNDGKLWRMSMGIELVFEYRFEEMSGTGVIQQIPVSLEGDLKEEFIVD